MDTLSLLAQGFGTSLLPMNLLIVVLGVLAGIFIGALPGLGPVAGAVAYERDGDVANYTFEVMLSTDPEDALYRFALEFALAAHLRLGRDLLGPDFMLWGDQYKARKG